MKGSGLGPGGRLRRREEMHLEKSQVKKPRATRTRVGSREAIRCKMKGKRGI